MILGLEIGDVVTMDVAADGAVKLHNNSKYYVKGVRRGGRDNNTVESPAFTVKGDADYVVAYGIQGDQTAYIVRYVDRNDQQIAPSRTYYGNVGDKPVVDETPETGDMIPVWMLVCMVSVFSMIAIMMKKRELNK